MPQSHEGSSAMKRFLRLTGSVATSDGGGQCSSSRALEPGGEAKGASAAEPSDRLLMTTTDLGSFKQSTQNRGKLHQEARSFLNAKCKAFGAQQGGGVQGEPIDSQEWPSWMEYIATHDAADKFIGNKGIIAIRIEEIEGVRDPNRGGKRRVDIVIYNADGEFFRVHPGSKARSDAQVIKGTWVTIGAPKPNGVGAAEPDIEFAARQYRLPPLVLTLEVAQQTPQIHCIGRGQMFSKLQKLPKWYPVELTQASIEDFPWWLWIPTTGRLRDDIIGCGIERIALMETTTDKATDYICRARFLIVHTDKTALLLNASHGMGHRLAYYIEYLDTDSSNYNWWVNWKP